MYCWFAADVTCISYAGGQEQSVSLLWELNTFIMQMPQKYIYIYCFIITVLIRFSARGAYLLLAPQGRALIRDRALI